MSNPVKSYISAILVIAVMLVACNNNEVAVHDQPVEIEQEFPLIVNGNYKVSPIIDPAVYPDRIAVLHSPEELDILPQDFCKQYLAEVDFSSSMLVAYRIISDDDIIGYEATARINPSTRVLHIAMEYTYIGGNTDELKEYVAVMQLPNVEYTSLNCAYTLNCAN